MSDVTGALQHSAPVVVTPEVEPVDLTVKERSTCRVCDGPLTQVLDLGPQAISEFTDEPGKLSHEKVPLTLMLCKAPDCQLVQLKHTAPREWLYKNYWYRSGTNEAMVRELGSIVFRARELQELREWDTVIDIGANDGTLLSMYKGIYSNRGGVLGSLLEDPCPQRIAFDPADNLTAELAKHCEMVIPSYFPAPKYDGPQAKIITSIAMFYDLEDPKAFVSEIKRVLAPDGIWILQLGDLLSLFINNAFDSICHEHLEYYSMTALRNLLKRYDLVPFQVERNETNGGSLRVFVKHAAAHPLPGSAVEEFESWEKRMGVHEERRFENLRVIISGIRELALNALNFRTVDLYGASTKGNTLVQTLFGGDASGLFRQVWERQPAKWGKYTPYGVPIVREEIARKSPPQALLVLPWHFKEGILAREVEYLRSGGRIVFPLPTVVEVA